MKIEKRFKIWNWILNVILIILGIIVVYLFAYRIFGNSPTDFQIIAGITGFFGAAILKNFSLTYKLNREIGELRLKSFHAFNGIKTDMESLKRDIFDIKELVKPKKKKK